MAFGGCVLRERDACVANYAVETREGGDDVIGEGEGGGVGGEIEMVDGYCGGRGRGG